MTLATIIHIFTELDLPVNTWICPIDMIDHITLSSDELIYLSDEKEKLNRKEIFIDTENELLITRILTKDGNNYKIKHIGQFVDFGQIGEICLRSKYASSIKPWLV